MYVIPFFLFSWRTTYWLQKRYEVRPKVPVAAPRGDYLPLERLWSYLTIKQLLDQQETVDEDRSDDKENTPEKKALALALKV